MAKTLEQELLHYFFQLNEAEKKSVLQMLKTFAKGKEEKGSRISVDDYNLEIQQAEAEYEKGDFTTHLQFIEQMKKW